MGRIVIETSIAAPRELCFDLALNVEAHAESAAFSGERVVLPGRLTGQLQTGDLIAFEGKHFGMRQRFVAKIVSIERPQRFVDEMVEGMFRSLRHDHIFEEAGENTVMRDVLEWESPLGFLGRLADSLCLESHMRWFVSTKQQRLARIAERRAGTEMVREKS